MNPSPPNPQGEQIFSTSIPGLIILQAKPLLTSPVPGALEYDGSAIYYTDHTGSRAQITLPSTGPTFTGLTVTGGASLGSLTVSASSHLLDVEANGIVYAYDGIQIRNASSIFSGVTLTNNGTISGGTIANPFLSGTMQVNSGASIVDSNGASLTPLPGSFVQYGAPAMNPGLPLGTADSGAPATPSSISIADVAGGNGTLIPGTTYYYRISACTFGGMESLAAAEIAHTPTGSTVKITLTSTGGYNKVYRSTTSGVYSQYFAAQANIFNDIGGSVIPGYLVADGSAVSQTAFPNVYAVFGSLYLPVGFTEKSGYFSLPQMGGTVPGPAGTYNQTLGTIQPSNVALIGAPSSATFPGWKSLGSLLIKT